MNLQPLTHAELSKTGRGVKKTGTCMNAPLPASRRSALSPSRPLNAIFPSCYLPPGAFFHTSIHHRRHNIIPILFLFLHVPGLPLRGIGRRITRAPNETPAQHWQHTCRRGAGFEMRRRPCVGVGRSVVPEAGFGRTGNSWNSVFEAVLLLCWHASDVPCLAFVVTPPVPHV